MPAAKLPTPPRVPAMTAARLMPVGFGLEAGVGVGVLAGALLPVLGDMFVVGPWAFGLVVGIVDSIEAGVADDVVEVCVTSGWLDVGVVGESTKVVLTMFTRSPGAVAHCHS
jgi:hypothetical protein